jgi:hypothetical protein
MSCSPWISLTYQMCGQQSYMMNCVIICDVLWPPQYAHIFIIELVVVAAVCITQHSVWPFGSMSQLDVFVCPDEGINMTHSCPLWTCFVIQVGASCQHRLPIIRALHHIHNGFCDVTCALYTSINVKLIYTRLTFTCKN